jgi:hypothetical protein
MTRGGRQTRLWFPILRAALAGALALGASVGVARERVAAGAQAETPASLQVTLFGIVATPGNTALDPRLAEIESQLRKLLPGHGFRLLGAPRSERLRAGESVRCNLGNGLVAATTLIRPFDENGKVELHCVLSQDGMTQFETRVATPPNQLFFCDRIRGDGSRLLIGIGAR